ncbi:arylsulfatase A-like enzyme [Rhodopirellula rubra]|uniref:Arylsulfatase A-like enzyme n=1 Tax=Aporhodopirellula rubra TaxID=980271 RepID=A0A7W5E318_9BACT|nr:arylsulfatase [Aporhodopirellula rubra]MBB3208902.1 arylsulfatase A-like enzyme [Aporhodopirellula rubra]
MPASRDLDSRDLDSHDLSAGVSAAGVVVLRCPNIPISPRDVVWIIVPLLLAHFRKQVPIMHRLLCFVCASFFAFPCMTSAADTSESRPNVILILADDMGSGDVQVLNPESKIQTPHLDKLAGDGMTFTDAHTPSSVCTPTRYGLLTGRYCWRTRLKSGVLNGYGEPLMTSHRVTIAGALKEAGYHTGIVGKWHLGLGFQKDGKNFDFTQPVSDGPHTHGFDSSFIIPASLDFPPYVYIRNGELTQFPSLPQAANGFPAYLRQGERSPDLVMENVLDDIARETDRYIDSHASGDEPFFLYVPLTGPHKPVLPHPRFHGKTELGPYGDFVMQVDETVGQIMKSIDDAEIRNNTIVIYTSDNGSFMRCTDNPDFVDHVDDETVQEYRSDHHRANGPYRGTKADIWEAGHRVPFFVRWPDQVQPGTKATQTVCLTDVFATLTEIAGVEMDTRSADDSYSFLPALSGKSFERAPVIHHSVSGMFAIRDGKWKLVLGNGSGGREQPRGKRDQRPYQLFDLSTDIAETNNVIADHPEVADRLEKACMAIREQSPSGRHE